MNKTLTNQERSFVSGSEAIDIERTRTHWRIANLEDEIETAGRMSRLVGDDSCSYWEPILEPYNPRRTKVCHLKAYGGVVVYPFVEPVEAIELKEGAALFLPDFAQLSIFGYGAKRTERLGSYADRFHDTFTRISVFGVSETVEIREGLDQFNLLVDVPEVRRNAPLKYRRRGLVLDKGSSSIVIRWFDSDDNEEICFAASPNHSDLVDLLPSQEIVAFVSFDRRKNRTREVLSYRSCALESSVEDHKLQSSLEPTEFDFQPDQ